MVDFFTKLKKKLQFSIFFNVILHRRKCRMKNYSAEICAVKTMHNS